jgi:hypothetical protein
MAGPIVRSRTWPWLRVALIVLATLCIIEFALGTFDPWGAHDKQDIRTIFKNFIPHPARGAAMAPGLHEYFRWSARIGTDYTRHVPDSDRHGSPTIVILGDSVAFGHGVNDGETFANVLAQQMSDARVMLAAATGYNSRNVRDTMADMAALYDVDLFVYLVTANDPMPEIEYWLAQDMHQTWLSLYVTHIIDVVSRGPDYDPYEWTPGNTMREDWLAMSEAGDVLFAAFEPGFDPMLFEAMPNVVLIPNYTDRASVIDGHPGPRGHREIAEALLPLIEERLGDE